MLKFIRAAALAATLLLVPAASLSSAPVQVEVRHAVIRTDTAPLALKKAAPAPYAQFGLDAAHDHEHASGLAPGQTAQDFEAWARRSPANIQELGAFRDTKRNLVTRDGQSAPIRVAEISPSAFRLGGTRPLLGRRGSTGTGML